MKRERIFAFMIVVIASLYFLGVYSYVHFGDSGFNWRLFENMNDRLSMLFMLLSFVWFIKDSEFRLIISIFSLFLFLYSIYEAAYIYDKCHDLPIRVRASDFSNIAVIYFGLMGVIICVGWVVNFYKKKQ